MELKINTLWRKRYQKEYDHSVEVVSTYIKNDKPIYMEDIQYLDVICHKLGMNMADCIKDIQFRTNKSSITIK
jgi:hypothetical protein